MHRKIIIFILGSGAIIAAGCHNATSPPVVTPSQFVVTALTCDKATVGAYTAQNVDTNMHDAWGLAFNQTYGFPWVANRASGTLTIYDSLGVPKTTVFRVFGPGQKVGDPTGLIQNTASQAFLVPSAGTNATWIASELNGTLAAVAGGSTYDSTYIVADRSSSSSFTGLTEATVGGVPYLYAPNIRNGSLDQFDQNYTRVQFSNGLHTAQGYVPFNAVVIDTQLFVTEAKSASGFVAIGPGNGGYVDVYSLTGSFEKTLITNDSLDSPWGVAIAPANFGSVSGDLLVGNFGDGTIHAYNRTTGAFVGTLNAASGSPIVIPGLWALVVYNNTLYVTAGPPGANGTYDGIFGKITLQ